MIKRIMHTLMVLFVGLALLTAGLFVHWMVFINRPLIPTPTSFEYTLASGKTLRDVIRDMQEKGMMAHPWYMRALAKLQGQSQHLKAGHYVFAADATPRTFLRKLYRGDVFTYNITLVEGWTVKELLDALQAQPRLIHKINAKKPDWKALREQLNISKKNVEGQFFPETYQFTVDATDIDVLKESHELLSSRLKALWAERDENLPYKTPYQALIAASMVEKESAIVSERPLIAGVIVRRLKLKMPLQIDATLIYGLYQRFKSQTVLTKKNLRTETPYNTYLRRGLPPTPIAMASENSLYAALHPAGGKALYFVARGDGSHVFSNSLAEHNKAVKKYLRQKKPVESKPNKKAGT